MRRRIERVTLRRGPIYKLLLLLLLLLQLNRILLLLRWFELLGYLKINRFIIRRINALTINLTEEGIWLQLIFRCIFAFPSSNWNRKATCIKRSSSPTHSWGFLQREQLAQNTADSRFFLRNFRLEKTLIRGILRFLWINHALLQAHTFRWLNRTTNRFRDHFIPTRIPIQVPCFIRRYQWRPHRSFVILLLREFRLRLRTNCSCHCIRVISTMSFRILLPLGARFQRGRIQFLNSILTLPLRSFLLIRFQNNARCCLEYWFTCRNILSRFLLHRWCRWLHELLLNSIHSDKPHSTATLTANAILVNAWFEFLLQHRLIRKKNHIALTY